MSIIIPVPDKKKTPLRLGFHNINHNGLQIEGQNFNFHGSQNLHEFDLIFWNTAGDSVAPSTSIKIKEGLDRFLKMGRDVVILHNQNPSYLLPDDFEFKIKRTTGKQVEFKPDKLTKKLSTFNKSSMNYDFCFDLLGVKHFPFLFVHGVEKVLGTWANYRSGRVLILPVQAIEFSKEKFHSFVDEVINFLNSIESMEEAPLWMGKYLLPDEIKKISRNNEISQTIEELNKEYEKNISQMEPLQKYKQLFYANDDKLEDIVEEVLKEIGCEVSGGGGNRVDRIIKLGEKPIVVEIKGVKGSAAEKNVMQVVKWQVEFMNEYETDTPPKGILIINTFREKDLADRTEVDFPDQISKMVNAHDICLLTAGQLFSMWYSVKNGSINPEQVSSLLYETVGQVHGFRDFLDILSSRNN